jgi:peptide deformylase
MKPKSPKSLELYDIMIKRGYPAEFCDQIFQFAMVNPVITKKTGAFQTEEGCLSLEGTRPCTRYKELAILSDRNRIMQKHDLEETNARWNEY